MKSKQARAFKHVNMFKSRGTAGVDEATPNALKNSCNASKDDNKVKEKKRTTAASDETTPTVDVTEPLTETRGTAGVDEATPNALKNSCNASKDDNKVKEKKRTTAASDETTPTVDVTEPLKETTVNRKRRRTPSSTSSDSDRAKSRTSTDDKKKAKNAKKRARRKARKDAEKKSNGQQERREVEEATTSLSPVPESPTKSKKLKNSPQAQPYDRVRMPNKPNVKKSKVPEVQNPVPPLVVATGTDGPSTSPPAKTSKPSTSPTTAVADEGAKKSKNSLQAGTSYDRVRTPNKPESPEKAKTSSPVAEAPSNSNQQEEEPSSSTTPVKPKKVKKVKDPEVLPPPLSQEEQIMKEHKGSNNELFEKILELYGVEIVEWRRNVKLSDLVLNPKVRPVDREAAKHLVQGLIDDRAGTLQDYKRTAMFGTDLPGGRVLVDEGNHRVTAAMAYNKIVKSYQQIQTLEFRYILNKPLTSNQISWLTRVLEMEVTRNKTPMKKRDIAQNCRRLLIENPLSEELTEKQKDDEAVRLVQFLYHPEDPILPSIRRFALLSDEDFQYIYKKWSKFNEGKPFWDPVLHNYPDKPVAVMKLLHQFDRQGESKNTNTWLNAECQAAPVEVTPLLKKHLAWDVKLDEKANLQWFNESIELPKNKGTYAGYSELELEEFLQRFQTWSEKTSAWKNLNKKPLDDLQLRRITLKKSYQIWYKKQGKTDDSSKPKKEQKTKCKLRGKCPLCTVKAWWPMKRFLDNGNEAAAALVIWTVGAMGEFSCPALDGPNFRYYQQYVDKDNNFKAESLIAAVQEDTGIFENAFDGTFTLADQSSEMHTSIESVLGRRRRRDTGDKEDEEPRGDSGDEEDEEPRGDTGDEEDEEPRGHTDDEEDEEPRGHTDDEEDEESRGHNGDEEDDQPTYPPFDEDEDGEPLEPFIRKKRVRAETRDTMIMKKSNFIVPVVEDEEDNRLNSKNPAGRKRKGRVPSVAEPGRKRRCIRGGRLEIVRKNKSGVSSTRKKHREVPGDLAQHGRKSTVAALSDE